MDIPTGVICRRLNPGERERLWETVHPHAYLRWAQYLVIRPTITGDRMRTLHVSWRSGRRTDRCVSRERARVRVGTRRARADTVGVLMRGRGALPGAAALPRMAT
jgi:hypothetical protein